MSRTLRGLLRALLIWTGPVLVVLVAVLAGFLAWVAGTSAGTRWALVTAVQQLDGEIGGVSGSLRRGIEIGHLTLDLPAVGLHFERLRLGVDWSQLSSRVLKVRELSAAVADVDLKDTPEDAEPEPDEAPFAMPSLPVRLAVDRLALDELVLRQAGTPSPWRVRGLQAALTAADDGGQLRLQRLEVAGAPLSADLQGELRLSSLQDPWPFELALDAQARGEGGDSLLCARDYLPTLPAGGKAPAAQKMAATPGEEKPQAGSQGRGQSAGQGSGRGAAQGQEACAVELRLTAGGSLQQLQVSLEGSGQDLRLEAQADVTPLAPFPLRGARADLTLPDDSSLHVKVDWESAGEGLAGRAAGELKTVRLDLGALSAGAVPPALLSTEGKFGLKLGAGGALQDLELALSVGEGSRWNGQPLAGRLAGHVEALAQAAQVIESAHAAGVAGSGAGEAEGNAGNVETAGGGARAAAKPAADGASAAPEDAPAIMPDWRRLALSSLDVDLRLGGSRLRAEGALGRPSDRLQVDAALPRLADAWPGLPGGTELKAVVEGALARHRLVLEGQYRPQEQASKAVGEAPIQLALGVAGGWQEDGRPAATAAAVPADSVPPPPSGRWQGTVERLTVAHAGLGLRLERPAPVAWRPGAAEPEWEWQLGETALVATLDDETLLAVQHRHSRGRGALVETAGAAPELRLSPSMLERLQQRFSPEEAAEKKRGGVKVRDQRRQALAELVLALDWELRYAGLPEGRVTLRRVSGDVRVPGDQPVPLGLRELALDLRATPANEASRLRAELSVATAKMGEAKVTAEALLRGGAKGLRVDPADSTRVSAQVDIRDLAWTSLFLGDEMALGGALRADVQAASRPDGTWQTSGDIRGEELRVVRIDDGVRLLDGRLAARLDGGQLIIDELYFPARLRAEPKEWRTAEWVNTNPDAKDGYLSVTGDWQLFDSRGRLQVTLHRYPILQRADRYAMMSGKLDLNLPLPRIDISGSLTADAGWFDLDMLGGIPTLDGDVVVLKDGVEEDLPEGPVDVSMQLDVDLGPRFYLTGYGVNSGLVGNMRITMAAGQLSAIGALRTRGGAIEAYGQRLQLRRGTITFQGDITSPTLDIEALRTNQAVQAGVKVAGTARRPRIDLVSYPAVSEIEKLSWFLLGRGPDESGADIGLLFSVGSSFLTEGEPFYRKFGIDALTMRSGKLGGTGSVLPVQSVVPSLEAGRGSEVEQRFVSASKRFANGFTLSLQQALADTGTVGRISYRLSRRLNAELNVGTVSGLALVWRWVARE